LLGRLSKCGPVPIGDAIDVGDAIEHTSGFDPTFEYVWNQPPTLILLTVGLFAVASAWFALWLVYVLFVIRYFPRVQTARKT